MTGLKSQIKTYCATKFKKIQTLICFCTSAVGHFFKRPDIFFKLLIRVTFKIVWVRRYSRQNVFSSFSHKSNEQTIQSRMPFSNSVVCIVEVLVVDEQLGRHRSMKYNSLWALALNLYIKSLIQLMNILSISSKIQSSKLTQQK